MRRTSFWLLVAIVLLCGGCAGWLESACTKAMPSLMTAQTITTDAIQALEEARGVESQLTAAQAAELEKYIETAYTALQVSTSAVHAAETACTTLDYGAIFKDFVSIWTLLRPLVQSETRMMAVGGQSSIPPRVRVHDPIIWQTMATQ